MESIETLNKRLIDVYGIYLDGQPMFRIMFSEDVMEKRLVTHTKDGFQLLTPQMAEVPRYRQYIHGKYILEGLKETQRLEKNGIVNEINYECMWVFEDGNGKAVPPVWVGIEHVLESVRCAMEGKSPKWTDPKDAEKDPKTAYEAREKRLKEIQDALFPNETEIGDALAYKEAIVVPRNYTKEN